MTDIQIETFLSVLESHSFSRASERMLVPQPTISHRICQLEEEIGAQLLTRTPKSVSLTNAGTAFLPYANSALEAIRSGKQKVEMLMRGINGSLIVACCPALMQSTMTQCFKSFLQEYPSISCSMISRSSEEILTALISGKIDAGILNYKTAEKDLIFRPLFQDEVLLVASPGWSSAARDLPLSILREEKVLIFPNDRMFHTFLTDELHERGITLENVTEVESIDMIKVMVNAGMGISFLPRHYVQEELNSGQLRLLELESWKKILRTTYLCTHSEQLSPTVQLFCREMEHLIRADIPETSSDK